VRGVIDGLGNPHPLLGALPAVYHEDDFTWRFIAAFDDALAPIISTLDNLEAYVDASIAPRDFVDWLAAWVGFPVGETWPEDRSRELVRMATEMYRWSGTVHGLKLLLRTYAGIEAEVVDSGGVTWSTKRADEDTPPATKATAKSKGSKGKGGTRPAGPPASGGDQAEHHVVVRVAQKQGRGLDRRQLEALINVTKPSHVTVTLEVQG